MFDIQSADRLREIIGTPNDLVRLKVHSALNQSAREFIARSPMAFLATCRSDGMPEVSPKGDAPGFVHVADERTLLIPERKGNKLAFSLQNILQNPKVGMIFLVPGTCETLRLQGTARLSDEPQLCARLSAREKPALLVTQVTVESCFFHCAKAFLRSDLWNPDTWRSPIAVSFGAEIAQRGGLERENIGEFDAAVRQRYQTDL